MEKNILIIKLGALGDVLRTTPILRILNGKITWIAKKEAFPLLKTPLINKLIDIDNKNQSEKLKREKFDLVLSLDEGFQAAKIASEIKTKKLIGVYLNPHPIPPQKVVPQCSSAIYRRQYYIGSDKSDHYNKLCKEGDKIIYTKESAKWFDLSLISKYGIKKANQLKKKNRLSYQEHLFNMLGKKFNGEEYVLNVKPKNINTTVIGIEKRAGEKWPAKQWIYYEQLIKKIKKQKSPHQNKFATGQAKIKIKILKQRKNLIDYIKDINNCSLIVCGDTLAMHLGIALKKKVVALFTCTSPEEIYDYGRMTKIVSPLLDKYFYERKFNSSINSAVGVKTVYQVIKKIL